MILMLPKISEAQIIRTTGNIAEASSQLIFYYDAEDEDPVTHITNTNDTEGVWIHVQIFRSFDVTDDNSDADVNKVICDERDFVDFLTPNDTHIYDYDLDNFPKNDGETNAAAGGLTTFEDINDTLGFVVITPVVSNTDFTAISFQHLIGTSHDEDDYSFNAMGRDAVDFATGAIVPDNTPLDGTTNGFVVLQPSELSFNFGSDEFSDSDEIDIVGIVFRDQYGPGGLLGYQVLPGESTWTPFIFDYNEDPTSCGMREVGCFIAIGLNDTLQQDNEELNPNPNIDETDDDLLCGGTETPEYPVPGGTIGVGDGFDIEFFGWTRMFVSGLDEFENHVGLIVNEDVDGGRWMNSK